MSIVIPAWNEAQRIGRSLERLDAYAAAAAQACEVIVVDDGSTDGTAAVAQALRPCVLTLRVLRQDRHAGKGACVKRGMLEAGGDIVLMTDADLSAAPDQIARLLPHFDAGADVVIGSRRLRDSVLDPPQPPYRRIMEWSFRNLRRSILLPDIRDTQCGFKAFTRQAAQAIFAQVTIDGLAFDCEVLALARSMKLTIREVGIRWCHHPDSRVRPLRDSLRVLRDLLRLKRRMLARDFQRGIGTDAA